MMKAAACFLFLLLSLQVAAEVMSPAGFVQRLEAGEQQRIVVYGTSLTAGGAWVGQFEQELKTRYPGQVELINRGKGGEHSRWGLENLQSRVIAARPNVVFIEFAINDATERFAITVDEARSNLEAMIGQIKSAQPDCEIILQVMNPATGRPEGHAGYRGNLGAYEQMVRDTAVSQGLRLIDHGPAWHALLSQGQEQWKQYVPDGLHPNAEGYAKYMLPTLLAGVGLAQDEAAYDLVVYGDAAGGVTAAVQGARMGKRVVLISQYGHLGGMTSSGLGWTDLGSPRILGGISREFYHRLYLHYHNDAAWVHEDRAQFKNQGQGVPALNSETKLASTFEPSAAEAVFDALVKEAGVQVVKGRLDLDNGVQMQGKRIVSLRLEDGTVVRGKMFIDASYEGDLLPGAGVSFVIGREANAEFDEQGNGNTGVAQKNQLPNGIDPYVVPGDPSSGLLPGVNADLGGQKGDGDHRLQAYCFRMVLTDVEDNRVTVQKPAGYDEAQYELLFRAIEVGQKGNFFKLSPMPNRKTDSNNNGGISTDYIGMNYGKDWNWATLNHQEREALAAKHRDWQLGLIWTLQNHPRVPESIRNYYAPWGLAKDEFTDNGHWPYNIYVREARRMRSDFVMTENHCKRSIPVEDPIGLGAYTLDSHNTQRVVHNGMVKNEGDIQSHLGGRAYGIAYRAIVPKAGECENLLVPWALSSTHIAFGSIRMEPVFMILGQSAATAASIAIDKDIPVQNVPYNTLREQLIRDGQVLE